MKILTICILCLGLLVISACSKTDISYNLTPNGSISVSTESTATLSQDTTTEINYPQDERSSDIKSSEESKPIYSSEEKASSKVNTDTAFVSESLETSSAVSSTESEVVEQISFATKEDAPEIAAKIVEYINKFRIESGNNATINLAGLTKYAEYRSVQLISNFAHDTKDERAAATALKYGQYVEPELFGMTGEPYYTANCGEAIAKADFVGTVDNIAERFALLAKNSPDHWSYVGSEQYRYIAVGITYESGVWYCCIAVTINNSDEQ